MAFYIPAQRSLEIKELLDESPTLLRHISNCDVTTCVDIGYDTSGLTITNQSDAPQMVYVAISNYQTTSNETPTAFRIDVRLNDI